MTIPTFEELYYSLWELSCRYSDLLTFRIIGKSHDGRYIPMVEIGKGDTGLYCISGLEGEDYLLSRQFPDLIALYCQAYEDGWQIHHFYPVRELLNNGRLCMIPVLNPDGYEILRTGYTALRNPAYRQQLRSFGVSSYHSYDGNARGAKLNACFKEEQLTAENENRALMKLFREYPGDGLLYFSIETKLKKATAIICPEAVPSFRQYRKNRRLAKGLKHTEGKMIPARICREKCKIPDSLEEYYARMSGSPSLHLQFPADLCENTGILEGFPLEGLFSLGLSNECFYTH